MRSMTPMKAAKISYIAVSSLICLFGIALIAFPDISVSVVGVIIGIAMVVFGAVKLIGYFSRDLFRLAFQFDLAFGILLITLGILVLLRPEQLMSFLCVIIGVAILADGLFKIQIAMDARKFGIRQWWLILALAILAGAVGCAMLFCPDSGAKVLMVLMGISLLSEGILNLCVALYTIKIVRNQRPDVIDVTDFRAED